LPQLASAPPIPGGAIISLIPASSRSRRFWLRWPAADDALSVRKRVEETAAPISSDQAEEIAANAVLVVVPTARLRAGGCHRE